MTRPFSHLSRSWVSACALTVAAAPHLADASIGSTDSLANTKSAAFLADGCRKSSGVAAAISPLPPAAQQAPLTALSRMRLAQSGIEPPPVDPVPAAAATRSETDMSAARLPCSALTTESADGGDLELGTVAIPVERTIFDARWDRVRRPAPRQLMRMVLARAEITKSTDEAELLERINRYVNHRVTYRSDDRNHSDRDVWSSASETLARGSGDCEDFAILKLQLLRAAGLDPKRMKLVLLRDLSLNAHHALLLIRAASGWVALDNLNDSVYEASQTQEVRPIVSFSESRRWIHGYADSQPVVAPAASTASAMEKMHRAPRAIQTETASANQLAAVAAHGDVRAIAIAATTFRLALASRR